MLKNNKTSFRIDGDKKKEKKKKKTKQRAKESEKEDPIPFAVVALPRSAFSGVEKSLHRDCEECEVSLDRIGSHS